MATVLTMLQLGVVNLNLLGWFPWLTTVAVSHLCLTLALNAAQLVLLLAVLPSCPASYSAHHITFNIISKTLVTVLGAHMAPAAAGAKAVWWQDWPGVTDCVTDGWAWPFMANLPAGLLPLQTAHYRQLLPLSRFLAGVRHFRRCVFILQLLEVLAATLPSA